MTSNQGKDERPAPEDAQEGISVRTDADPVDAPAEEDGLRAIYEDEGEMPDFTKLSQRPSGTLTRWLLRIILVLIVISAAAWGGFFLWSSGLFKDARIVSAEIEGPREPMSGEEVFYTFRYENTGDVPVAAMELKLSLPERFAVTSMSPEPTEGNAWRIGSLEAGSDGAVIIGGIFQADVPSTQTMQALLTYKPANFSSEFEEIETASIAIEESVLDVSLSGPEKTIAGDEIAYTVNVQNSSGKRVEGVLATMSLPENFAFASAEPAPAEDGVAEWIIDALEPGELAAITLTGSYTSTAAGEQSVFARGHFQRDGDRLLQSEETVVTDVLSGTLSLNLIVDGASGDQTAELGETLLVSLDYANESPDAVNGLALELSIDPPEGDTRALPLDLAAVDAGEVERSGNAFRFDPAVREDFAEILPGTDGVIDLAIPIDGEIDLASTADAFVLRLTASLEKVGSIESVRTIETSPIAIELNSDVAFDATARYFTEEGVEVGSGPLPPRVGETTKYRVSWDVENSLHALNGTTVTTVLPADVAWTGAATTDIGTLVYDDTTRIVSWRINRLPEDVNAARAMFEVAITPDENDAGSFFKLTNVSSLETTDSKTGDTVTRSRDVLTTELPEDEEARGRGVVEE